MAYTPSQEPGRQPAAASTSVVSATDSPLVVEQTGDTINLFAQMLSSLNALQSVKGVLSDLRVTPTGTVTVAGSLTTVTTVTTCTTVTTVGGISALGGWQATNAVPNWQNQTAVQSFINNIARS